MLERIRNRIDCTLVSTGPTHLCNMVSTLYRSRGKSVTLTFIMSVETTGFKYLCLSCIGIDADIRAQHITVN
jgi:hypothetical protein